MPRRTSSRLRGGAAASGCEEGGGGGAGGASDGDSSGGGGSVVCPPFPPSPGKRKARSPVEDEHGFAAAGVVNPHPVRCASFQSPKKRAQGVGDRCSGPFDKENDTGGGLSAPVFGDGGFRLSAYSAFSHHASAKPRVGARRRSREEAAATSVHSPVDAPTTPRVPTAGSAAGKGPMLPFLLAPASVTKSPDLRRKASSRRAPRSSRGVGSNSNSSSSGSGLRRSRDCSNSPSEIPPVPTPPPGAAAAAAAAASGANNDIISLSSSHDAPPAATPHKGGRHSARSGAGCAAGGRRSSTPSTPTAGSAAVAAMTSSAESASAASPIEGRTGGGPAGSYRRVVGGARLGPGGGGGGGTTSDHSPHRSPGLDNIHRLTESLQKWDPGSRYASPADDNIGERVDGRAGAGGASGRAGGVGGVKDVGASWNGQELRGTLEKERVGRGRRRRHSVTSAEDMYPQGTTQARFGDHSPISPASSAASINLGEFDACTPASAGRPWRSSPRRAEGGAPASGGSVRRAAGGSGGGSGAGDDEGAGSAEHFGIVRMEGSWSEDETGPSGTAMRLAFSPGKLTILWQLFLC